MKNIFRVGFVELLIKFGRQVIEKSIFTRTTHFVIHLDDVWNLWSQKIRWMMRSKGKQQQLYWNVNKSHHLEGCFHVTFKCYVHFLAQLGRNATRWCEWIKTRDDITTILSMMYCSIIKRAAAIRAKSPLSTTYEKSRTPLYGSILSSLFFSSSGYSILFGYYLAKFCCLKSNNKKSFFWHETKKNGEKSLEQIMSSGAIFLCLCIKHIVHNCS